MINKYDDFLLENLISEAYLIYSNSFKKVLSKIKTPVSKILREIEVSDLNVPQNYLDISKDSNELITFIPSRRLNTLLEDNIKVEYTTGSPLTHNISANGVIFDKLKYTPDVDYYKPSSGDVGKIISMAKSDSSNKIYFYVEFDGGKCVINKDYVKVLDSKFWTTNRQELRIGRAVKSILNASGYKDIKEKEIEDFVNKWKSSYDNMNNAFANFELINGDQIAYWYNRRNYSECRGPLGSSCMSSVPDAFFDIYVKNPKVCNLLILKDGDKIKGRALVWHLTRPEGVTFMDRVYYVYDSDLDLFRDYAVSQGWYYKKYNDSSETYVMIGGSGEVNRGDLFVQLSGKSYRSFPYVDTIKYFDSSSNTLSTNSSNGYCLENTDGSGEDSPCEVCGGSGEIECPECYGDGEVDCYKCRGDGEIECSVCDGDGLVECGECDGSGEDSDGKSCTECDGDGKIKCDSCKGDGQIECPDCSGSTKETCEECNGRGVVPCYECG